MLSMGKGFIPDMENHEQLWAAGKSDFSLKKSL